MEKPAVEFFKKTCRFHLVHRKHQWSGEVWQNLSSGLNSCPQFWFLSTSPAFKNIGNNIQQVQSDMIAKYCKCSQIDLAISGSHSWKQGKVMFVSFLLSSTQHCNRLGSLREDALPGDSNFHRGLKKNEPRVNVGSPPMIQQRHLFFSPDKFIRSDFLCDKISIHEFLVQGCSAKPSSPTHPSHSLEHPERRCGFPKMVKIVDILERKTIKTSQPSLAPIVERCLKFRVFWAKITQSLAPLVKI